MSTSWVLHNAHRNTVNVCNAQWLVGGAVTGVQPMLAAWPKSQNRRSRQTWSIYKIAAKQTWLGEIEAPDEVAAIDKAAEQFKVLATRLMVMRRR